MINEEIIREFNATSDTDYIDFDYIQCNYKGNMGVLICQYYYILPLIERLCRQLLHKERLDAANIETVDNRYRTMYSIIKVNEEVLIELIGRNAVICVRDVFSDDGLRNKILHNKPIDTYGLRKNELISTYRWLLESLESILKGL